jgi:hypothetical protein
VFRIPLQLLFEKCFILGRTERDIFKNAYWSSREVPILMKPEISRQFRKILKYHISWKMGAELFIADGRKDRQT